MRWHEIVEAKASIRPEMIHAAIRGVVKVFGINAFQGHCGDFALALNTALGGGGTFLAADSGDHYEFVDHIALKFKGRLYDGSGLITRDAFRSYAQDEDDSLKNASFFEVNAADVGRYVDASAMGSPLDVEWTAYSIHAALGYMQAYPIEQARLKLVEMIMKQKQEDARPDIEAKIARTSDRLVYAMMVKYEEDDA